MGIEGSPRISDTTGHRIETGHGIETRPEKSPNLPERAPDESEIKGRRISQLFSSFGSVLLGEGIASEVEVYKRLYVHVFYRLSDNPDEVIHVQGYPGGSRDTKTLVLARVMDYEGMHTTRQRAQRRGFSLIGSEHEAVVREGTLTAIEYRHSALSALLGNLAPEAAIPLARLKQLGVEE